MTVYREGVRFHLDRSDYMQWHVYANLPDQSWRSALPLITNGCTVLDIGANCGAFSLKLAKYISKQEISNSKIIAFEPNPFTTKIFKTNLNLNEELIELTKLHSLALGNENGTCAMSFDRENSGSSHITSVDYGSIKIMRLDNFVEEHNLQNICFIKIDVEGFEPDVINGAVETIEKFRPAIYIEMTNDCFEKRGSSCEKIIDQLYDWGYHLQVETDRGFVTYKDLKQETGNFFQYNLLATSI